MRTKWTVTCLLVPLLGLAGCLTGCAASAVQWQVDEVQMDTQFEVSWGTSVKIGFPGTVRGSAAGQGETAKPEPADEP